MFAMFGCAGGGSSASGGEGRASVFITDDLNTGFDHVWVSIKAVALTAPSGERVLFEDPAGRVVDLKTLRDAGGNRFVFLSQSNIPRGAYTGLRIVVDKDVVIYPAGATTGTDATFEGSASEDKTFSLAFPAGSKVLGTGDDLVVDFDLSSWSLNGSVVTAPGGQFLKVGDDRFLTNQERHENEDYHGVVSNLAGRGTDQTFTLTSRQSSFLVRMSRNVVIFNESGAPSATLANGQRVEVRGTFDAAGDFLVATGIKIEDQEDQDEDEAKGAAISPNVAAGTFTLAVTEVEGFLPSNVQVEVATTASTRFFTKGGVRITQAEFFVLISDTTPDEVKVDGSYNASTNTLVARKVKIEIDDDDDDDGDLRGEIEGIASAENETAGTFQVTVMEWEGVPLSRNDVLTVSTSQGTRFRIESDNVSREQFFAAMANGARVKAEGRIDVSAKTVQATTVRLESEDGGGGDD